MKQQNKENASRDPLVLRLDAILALLVEMGRGKEGFTEATTARTLKSVGLTPTEIARILGKKSATDVSQYLYQKKDKG
jgi:hypothetical protein